MIVVDRQLPLQGVEQTEEITVCYLCMHPTNYLKPCVLCKKQICAVCRRVKGGVICLECIEQRDES